MPTKGGDRKEGKSTFREGRKAPTKEAGIENIKQPRVLWAGKRPQLGERMQTKGAKNNMIITKRW